MDLVAPWHVGSSRTRARTRVPCIGRRTLNHCATREVPIQLLSVRIQAHMCLIPKPMLLSEVTSKFPVRKSNDFLNDNYILKLPSFKLHGAAFHTFFFPLCISAYCGFSFWMLNDKSLLFYLCKYISSYLESSFTPLLSTSCLFFFFFLAVPHGLWHLSSLTRD